MSGTVEVRRPRVRGLEERFESRILPLFMRRTHAVTELLPELRPVYIDYSRLLAMKCELVRTSGSRFRAIVPVALTAL